MIHVFMFQWKRLMKQPFLVVMFVGMTVLFVYFMGGAQINATVTVPVYSESLSEEELGEWLERLNEDESINFEQRDYESIEKGIRMNEIGFAMAIDDDTYHFLAGREDGQISIVNQHAYQVFNEHNRLEEVKEDFPDSELVVTDFISVELSQTSQISSQDQFSQFVLMGMTLYFSAFSILYLMMNLQEEKKMGTWDRLIVSPVTRTQLYFGHLLHYYLVGVAQVLLSFIILTNLLGIDLGTNYLSMVAVGMAFIFAIVSLGILLVALVPTPQSLQIIIPIVTTSMAMLGGAFWSLSIVSNRLLLFLAELMPIKHGLYGMVAAVFQNEPVSGLLQPIGILLLMGVLFMGIGLNLMERPAEK